MEIGIEFTLKDGSKDWYDPVDENEFDSNQTDTLYDFHALRLHYQVLKAQIRSVRKYQLCPVCGNEARHGRCIHDRR